MQDIENIVGFPDKRFSQKSQIVDNTANDSANYNSVANLRTRLSAVNPGYFTQARLNQMTKNDMVYALRLADDAAGM